MNTAFERRLEALERSNGPSRIDAITIIIICPFGTPPIPESAEVYGETLFPSADETMDDFLVRTRAKASSLAPAGSIARSVVNTRTVTLEFQYEKP